jgi:signal transduction histidine kinase
MRTWGQRRPAVLIVVAILILLLPLLAYLQYEWLGKVSEREREQKQAALRRALGQFSQDFNREIARMFMQFQDRPVPSIHNLVKYEKLYAHWETTAPYPRLLRDIFYYESDSAGVHRLQRLDASSGVWHSVDWISEFGPQRALSDPIDARIPAVVVPIFEMGQRSQDPSILSLEIQGQLILRLNVAYIQEEFVPALVRSHFGAATASDFRLQISSSDDDSRIIYSSDGSDPAVPIQGAGDATETLLTLRLERFQNLMPAELPFVSTAPAAGMRGDRVFSLHIGPLAGAPAMIGEAFIDDGAWKITAVHRSGSLDAAVAQLRRRNLLICFGILAVLAAGIGIVIVSAARAQRLARQQIEFVSTVSHELRTPLAVICSAGENLADGVVGDPERLKSYGKVVRDEGRRLTEMVEQVLSFAGLQSGLKRQTFVPVDLPEIIDRALAAFEIPIRENGFSVERRIPEDVPPVMAEPVSLTRAVHNLLSNAIKYAGEERWIGLSIFTEGQWLKLTVQDRGPGIPSADLPHIFEPFYRGRSAVEGQIHGSGLGLSLVKQAVDQHNGSIHVASSPGTGSTFCICLPVGPPLEISSI